jgi:hypothetical protein
MIRNRSGPETSTAVEGGTRKADELGSSIASENNSIVTLPQAALISRIKAHIAAGDKAASKAEDHYIAAGQHLATLKREHAGSWAEWEALLKSKVGVSTGRASELMQIADGRKTLAELRADKNETSKIAHAKERSSLNSEEDAEASDEEHRRPKKPVLSPDEEREFEEVVTPPAILEKLRAAEIKITGLQSEVEELRLENANLLRQIEAFNSPVRCEFVEDDGGREAAGYGGATGDCVARAIAIATRKPYAEVFEALKARHVGFVKRNPDSYEARVRRGTKPIDNGCIERVYAPYLKSLGWNYTRIRERVYLRAGALPNGRLIIDLDRHFVALVDGTIRDTFDSGGAGKRPVKGYWRAAS